MAVDTMEGSSDGIALVVDADEEFAALTASTLRRINLPVRVALTAGEAFEAMADGRPAIVLLEVILPDMTGYEVCRELRDAYGDELPIIFMSGTRTEPADRIAGLVIGANDYLSKPLEQGELLARVRNLVRRSGGPRRGHAGLTNREQEVLQLLADGLDQRAIAERLVISPRTVATHLERIIAKAGVHSRAQAVAWAYRQGLIRRP
jgi:DNA-binding NarL/FixJ family response regulator